MSESPGLRSLLCAVDDMFAPKRGISSTLREAQGELITDLDPECSRRTCEGVSICASPSVILDLSD